MNRPAPDIKSVAGKTLDLAERIEILVIGAGPAGLAAAIAAAGAGAGVVLVDENPVDPRAMGDDIPLHYGQAMSGAVRNRNGTLEAWVASEPMIEAAFAAGVDVRLGTACWGLYAGRPGLDWLPGTVAALASGDDVTMVGAGRVIVATGRRDMGLAFPGWDLPGVSGATAAVALAGRYGAYQPTRVVVAGSTTEALLAALDLQSRGVEIAAVVEPGPEPVGAPDLVDRFAAAGVAIRTGTLLQAAEGVDRVAAVRLAGPDRNGGPAGTETVVACDGVVLAVGAVPVVDLLDAAGCRIGADPVRGGHVPVLDGTGRTSLPNVWAVGDCAGIWPAKSRDRAVAEAEGRRAAAAALGLDDDGPVARPEAEHDMAAYRVAWMTAGLERFGPDCTVCQCEGVTAREIMEVRPPRYVEGPADTRNDRRLATLLGPDTPDPDHVKRLTRAGMGLCQGRRCREQVAALLSLASGAPVHAIRLAGYRAPVRPISLAAAGSISEDPTQAAHWDSWFGMKAQWRPFWDVPPLYTVADGEADTAPIVSE